MLSRGESQHGFQTPTTLQSFHSFHKIKYIRSTTTVTPPPRGKSKRQKETKQPPPPKKTKRRNTGWLPISAITSRVRKHISLRPADLASVLVDLRTVRDAVAQPTAEGAAFDTVHLKTTVSVTTQNKKKKKKKGGSSVHVDIYVGGG